MLGCASNYFERKKSSYTNYNVRPLLGAYYLLYSIFSSQDIFFPRFSFLWWTKRWDWLGIHIRDEDCWCPRRLHDEFPLVFSPFPRYWWCWSYYNERCLSTSIIFERKYVLVRYTCTTRNQPRKYNWESPSGQPAYCGAIPRNGRENKRGKRWLDEDFCDAVSDVNGFYMID